MSAPVVVQVNPDVNETDVVLGAPIVITFDQAIDTTSLTDASFSVTLPSQTQVITSEELISRGNPLQEQSPQPVTGTFTFATDTQGRTVATFTPDKSLRPNTQYTALLMGADAELATEDVQNPAGEVMATSYEWTFVQDLVSPSCPNQNSSRAGVDTCRNSHRNCFPRAQRDISYGYQQAIFEVVIRARDTRQLTPRSLFP